MKYIIGIDLGGTFIKSAIIEKTGRIISRDKIDTGSNKNPEKIAARINKNIIQTARNNNIKLNNILCIGIGSPGTVRSKTGIVEYSPNFKSWKNVPFKKMIASKFKKCHTGLYNDANAAAYGEIWKGAGKYASNFILYTLGTGIGGGIILNGKLYTGSDEAAGELGHVTIIPDGPLCSCGNRGCLEALSSATAVVRRSIEGINRGAKTSLRKNFKEKTLTCKSVYNAA